MDYRLLGPLEVRAGDRALSLGGPRQRGVLAVLLLRAGENVSTDTLIDEVWGLRPPATVNANLHNCIFRRRTARPHRTVRWGGSTAPPAGGSRTREWLARLAAILGPGRASSRSPGSRGRPVRSSCGRSVSGPARHLPPGATAETRRGAQRCSPSRLSRPSRSRASATRAIRRSARPDPPSSRPSPRTARRAVW